MRMAQVIPAQEVSGAWTVNHGLHRNLENRLKTLPVDGIVCHVLKGQIEYDFELPEPAGRGRVPVRSRGSA